MTTGKTIALTRWTFVGKVMSLLFNMLSRLVIIFFAWILFSYDLWQIVRAERLLWELFVYRWEYRWSESENGDFYSGGGSGIGDKWIDARNTERYETKEKLRVTPRSLLWAPAWVMVVFIEIWSTSRKEDLFGVNGESRAWFGTYCIWPDVE